MIPYCFPNKKLCEKFKNIRIVYYSPDDQSKSVINQDKYYLLKLFKI